MRKVSWLLVLLPAMAFGNAEAQHASTEPNSDQRASWSPKLELAASAGLISATPGPNDHGYGDHWFGDGRYAGSLAYYWTRNLKTEFEHQWSGEGARYEQGLVNVGGVIHPSGREVFYQLQQSSLRLVWQFGDNMWVHPYVSAGAVLDMQRRRSFSPPVYQPAVRGTMVVRPPLEEDHGTTYRGGWTLGGGAKFYVTQRAFVSAGVVGTSSRPGATISVLTGFGIDF